MKSLRTVSYTHLDVYKRQTLDCSEPYVLVRYENGIAKEMCIRDRQLQRSNSERQ